MALRSLAAATALVILATGTQAADTARTTYAFYPYPPIAMKDGGKRSGYATEIMGEALRRAELTVDEIELPVNRALSFVINEPNNFIVGTKTPEAGVKFAITWPFCFETVNHALVIAADKPYQSIETMPRNARIGAFLSYTLKDYLTQQGFTDISLVRENSQLPGLLMKDHIDAWASFDSAARYLLESEGTDLAKVRSLPVKRYSFCAVTSRDTDPKLMERVREAYRTMLDDGTRARIRARYERYLGPDLPPDPATWSQPASQ
jgi:hypothetical protein